MGKISDEAKQLWETYPQLRPEAMKKEESKNETVKGFLAALVLLVSCFYSYSVAEPVKEEVTISDDGWVEVPLGLYIPVLRTKFYYIIHVQ